MAAAKNCPQCNKQVPVACKKCGCGHTFFVARRGASCVSTNRENSEESEEMPTSPQGQEELKPTRRSGRVTRERPNFYDALEYENQTRRQKQLLRQSKQSKSEDQDEGSDESDKAAAGRLSQEKSAKVGVEKPKKRRGRPPGITGSRKPGQGVKITTGGTTSRPRKPSGNLEKGPESPSSWEIADIALLQGVSAEKALQYNIVLQDINAKIPRVSWRAGE